ncbi:MAG: nucleotide exchange factor GrpE [Promethearchaeota archaeon]
MTGKMEKKLSEQDKKKEEMEANNNETNTKEEIKDIVKERVDAEPELLEEKDGADQKLLEFYSKEDLVNKVREYEKQLEDKDKKINELDGWKKKFTHLQAEFENAQKRWEKSRQDLRTQYTASVLKSFLPLYDSFKKAIDSNHENDTLKQFYNQFLNILKSNGADAIKVNINDSFDYSIHEALSSIEKTDVPENSIIDIIQDGWKIGKDVLRYTKVIISKKPKPPEPEPETTQESECAADVAINEQEQTDTDQSEAENEND